MARLPCLCLPGCTQHVIQRGNNRETCFYDEAANKADLSFLKGTAAKYSVVIHAFVLMSNHVHLLVTPSDEKGVGRMMQAQGRKYVQYFNFTYGRTGTLWEGRYKSTLVDSDSYLLTVYRYIELNPVRANMVAHASEYPWPSYQGNAVGKSVQ
jgi:REP-associated tyrosine transposase